jgi:hypothetical protein
VIDERRRIVTATDVWARSPAFRDTIRFTVLPPSGTLEIFLGCRMFGTRRRPMSRKYRFRPAIASSCHPTRSRRTLSRTRRAERAFDGKTTATPRAS